MVGGRLNGSTCFQRADEGRTIVNPLGRPSSPPQPQGPPEGFRNPAQSAPESPCPGRGSHGRGGAGVRPQEISRSARAPRRRFLEGAADVDRGRSREAPRGVARGAPGAGEEFAKERLYKDGRGARADRAADRTPPAAGQISTLAVSRGKRPLVPIPELSILSA